MKPVLLALIAFSLCLPVLAQNKLKPIPLRKPKARVMGMMAWEGKERVFLEIKVPGREATPIYHALMESESANGFKVLSIDPGKGEVKLDIKGQVVSSVVPDWPAVPKANPPKKGSVTLSFSKAPLEIVLDVFGGLSGRSIIAASNRPRVFFDLKPQAPMSKADCLTVLINMVNSKAGLIRPLGNKFVQVESHTLTRLASVLRPVPVPSKRFLLVNAPAAKDDVSAGLRFQNTPLDLVLDVFGELTGRSIIKPANLPQVVISFKPQGPMTEKDVVEAIQALLDVNGIGVVLQGDKTAFVLPASLLPHAPYYIGKMYANGQGYINRPGEGTEAVPAVVENELLSGLDPDFLQGSDLNASEVQPIEKEKVTQVPPGGALEWIRVEKDYAKALEWYTKSAKQGDAKGQNNLGSMYRNGLGVEKDMVKCLAWWTLAAEQGDKYAIESKPKAEAKMTPDQIAKAKALAKEMNKSNQKPVPTRPPDLKPVPTRPPLKSIPERK